ncbi:MAG: hypothetical protein NW206_12825 [Hyphomonadaceae bacterium]|nr:hypothetical protein [Hyphomonadaceae bacterium]
MSALGRSRLITAIFVAPLGGCVVGTLVFGVGNLIARQSWADLTALAVLPIYAIVYGCTIGITWTVLMLLPLHSLLFRLRQRHVWGYLAIGILGGAAAAQIFFWSAFLVTSGQYSAESAGDDSVAQTPFASVLATCVALVFWLLRRPDRDAEAPNPANSTP